MPEPLQYTLRAVDDRPDAKHAVAFADPSSPYTFLVSGTLEAVCRTLGDEFVHLVSHPEGDTYTLACHVPQHAADVLFRARMNWGIRQRHSVAEPEFVRFYGGRLALLELMREIVPAYATYFRFAPRRERVLFLGGRRWTGPACRGSWSASTTVSFAAAPCCATDRCR